MTPGREGPCAICGEYLNDDMIQMLWEGECVHYTEPFSREALDRAMALTATEATKRTERRLACECHKVALPGSGGSDG